MDYNIRHETIDDVQAISNLIERSFKDVPYSDNKEQIIVEKLRNEQSLAISMVVEYRSEIIAYGAISPVKISDGSADWYGLGPIAVAPEWQNKKIGTELIKALLTQLRSLEASGCVVLGEPKFYQRFGFYNNEKLILSGVPKEYFQVLSFGNASAKGEVFYNKAFFE